MDWLERTQLLLGEDKLKRLKNAHVLVAGLGGVGAYAAEMLCRAGIGKLTLIDGDKVELTNLNRQLPATLSRIGQNKTDILAERFRDINPDIELNLIAKFISDEKMFEILDEDFDYVVDAIDTLSPKVFLIYNSLQKGLKIVSSMGSGGKLNPEMVKSADISKSYNCRLAKMLRKRLSKLGIKKGFTVVFSPEDVPEEAVIPDEGQNKKSTVGTISYMPPVFGCHLASVVIRDLVGSL